MFKHLTDDDLDFLSENTKVRRYKKDQVIVTEGGKREFIYLVEKGVIKVCQTTSDGRHVIIGVKKKNTMIGDSSLFVDKEKPSIVTLIALEESIVYVVKISDLESLVSNNIDLAVDVIKALGNELEQAVERIKNLALDDTFTKVTRLLTYLSETDGIEDEETVEIDLPLTRQELGCLIGTSRETVSRILNQLAKEGVLELDGRLIKILKKEKLEEWL